MDSTIRQFRGSVPLKLGLFFVPLVGCRPFLPQNFVLGALFASNEVLETHIAPFLDQLNAFERFCLSGAVFLIVGPTMIQTPLEFCI